MTDAPWNSAWNRVRSLPDFIDLIDSRFHQNGLLPSSDIVRKGFENWISRRQYDPDSRGHEDTRSAIAQFYQTSGLHVKTSNIIVTAGTSEAYRLIFTALAKAGETVAVPRPGYPLFEHLAQHARLSTVAYQQTWTRRWQPDPQSLDSLKSASPRFVVLISPNNPTGQTLDEATIRQLDSVCPPSTIWIVDEVFDAFRDPSQGLPRPGALLPHRKVATLNGISKRFGSPDLKVSWIALSGPDSWTERASEELSFMNDAYLSASDFSQSLVPDLFSSSDEWQQSVRQLLSKNRSVLEQWMRRESGIAGILPDGGIHGLMRFDRLQGLYDDETWAVALLEQAHVAVHPGFFYDVDEPGVWVVYSLLCRPDRFSEGLSRISRVLSSIGALRETHP